MMYEKATQDEKEKYAGAFVWQIPVTSNGIGGFVVAGEQQLPQSFQSGAGDGEVVHDAITIYPTCP
jgi:hypothetical protein